MAIDLTKALDLLYDQVGYRESGNNHQKYSPAVPGLEWSQNQPWCQTMQAWIDMMAGGDPTEDFPLTASCWAATQWGRRNGRFSATPGVGAYVMYGPAGEVHVDRVVEVHPTYVVVIGGNTSGSNAGRYYNGDGVYRKVVQRSSRSIYGYVMPVYGSSDKGDDDVPEFGWYSTSGGQTLQSGEWELLGFDNKQGEGAGEYYSVVFGESVYSLNAFITLEGAYLSAGDEAQLRVAHYKEEGGISLPSGILEPDADGAGVERLQEGLKLLGADLGQWGADGDYGSMTTAAVKFVQRKGGLTGGDVDGVYGPQTRDVMQDLAGPRTYRKTMSHPITSAVHAGGNLHFSYSINEQVPEGYRLRVEAVQYSGHPVKVAAAKVTVHEWK